MSVKNFIIILILIGMMFFDVPVYALSVSAEYACVIEMNSGEVVYAKNADIKYSMASTTKIMTALLALENSNPDDIVTASRNASMQEGSSIYLKAGDKIYMQDLLYGLMLNSGNDAAVAAAEFVGKSVDNFAQMMTERAKEIGAKNTQFKNPNGLDADGHYTTAYDLALITREAMKNEVFREIVGTKSKKVTLINNSADVYFTNHNKLLKMYDGTTGVKTGYTRATGRCLVSSAERNGMEFIAVTLKAPNDWTDHKNMLDYAFSEYERKTVFSANDVIKQINIGKNTSDLFIDKSIELTVKKNGRSDCEIVLHIADDIYPPVNKGEKVGVAEIMQNNICVGNVNIVSGSDVYEEKTDKVSLYEIYKKILTVWFKM